MLAVSRLEFVFPDPCQPDPRRGSGRDPHAQAPSVSSTAQSHPDPHPALNLQLLPWAPELPAGNMNISEVSHSSCSPSREPHALLSPPHPSGSQGKPWAVPHTPLLGSLQILHLHMGLVLFCISENGSLLA